MILKFVTFFRIILKKYFPKFYKKSDKLRTILFKRWFSKKVEINLIEEFYEFCPAGSGSIDLINKNIIYNIKNISNSLNLLISNNKIPQNISILKSQPEDSKKLMELLKEHGSDKYLHDYHLVYAHIFKHYAIDRILEIGLGSKDSKFLSNMWNFGVPGGCLRAFSAFLGSNVQLVGLDIDEKILFSDKNIETFKFDQLNVNQVKSFSINNKNSFNLVIDDGLHSNVSVINTISMCMEVLKKNGLIVIEDLFEEQLKFVKIAFELNKDYFDYEIYKLNKVFIFIAKKLK